MVTDQQVALLRQRQMEGKRQQTAAAMAAMAGMSERSARKWQCGPLPSETKTERTRGARAPTPLTASGRKKSYPCSKARPPAGSGQRQLSSGWRRNSPAGSAPPSSAPCNADYRTGGHSTVRIRRSTSPRSIHRAGSGGLLPPGASTGPGGAARLHPLQLPGSNHRRPALPPPAVPAGVEPFRVAPRRGGCWRDLCGPEAGTAERALGTGRRAPGHTLRQQLGPHP